MRKAPATQIDQLWSAIKQAVDSHLSERPIWLSTAGLGVSWLHIRTDSRPNYYRHKPYPAIEYWGNQHRAGSMQTKLRVVGGRPLPRCDWTRFSAQRRQTALGLRPRPLQVERR